MWDNFKEVARFFWKLQRPVELALFDWEKGYWQIPTRIDQWPYLMVQDFDGKMLLNIRITFGGVAGCGSFGRPADAWKEIMQTEFDLIHIFGWVENNLFFREKVLLTNMSAVVERSAELGVKTNDKKYSDFLGKQKFIGFLWDGEHRTVTLPRGKKEAQHKQIQKFLVPVAQFSFKDAQVLSGRCGTTLGGRIELERDVCLKGCLS
ncbi:hypothetical protein PCASD_01463 [Puccinia coronata f. sp. avenae]|uniref:Uncharacterized protein n=1 Tax=Puccinia coronata f. sp. avenae TaxID=200324 RepID=A0A2N5VKG4_9BASI|nr:hypothetical protein PCASD_01463 [Puccinia coronata f. sp. avenae]